MADEKKISAREAAIAVLKKAEELFKASPISKGEMPPAEHKKPEHNVTPTDNVQIDKEVSPEHNVNPEWGSDPAVKGHIKLAKFLGRMDHKRTSKKAVM